MASPVCEALQSTVYYTWTFFMSFSLCNTRLYLAAFSASLSLLGQNDQSHLATNGVIYSALQTSTLCFLRSV